MAQLASSSILQERSTTNASAAQGGWKQLFHFPSLRSKRWCSRRGGTAYIAPRSQSFLYVIGRNQATATVDTTIGEPVLSLRRQQSGELLATTAYGAIYRMAADSVLSTHEPARLMLTITPNPASDRVAITADGGIKRVRVYDLIGTVQADIVAQQPAPAKTIEIGSLPAGYYTVVVHTALGITAHPLIIER